MENARVEPAWRGARKVYARALRRSERERRMQAEGAMQYLVCVSCDCNPHNGKYASITYIAHSLSPAPHFSPCTGSPQYMAYTGIDPLRGGACRLARDWALSLLQ